MCLFFTCAGWWVVFRLLQDEEPIVRMRACVLVESSMCVDVKRTLSMFDSVAQTNFFNREPHIQTTSTIREDDIMQSVKECVQEVSRVATPLHDTLVLRLVAQLLKMRISKSLFLQQQRDRIRLIVNVLKSATSAGSNFKTAHDAVIFATEPDNCYEEPIIALRLIEN